MSAEETEQTSVRWEPLSVREGRSEPDGPFDGMPAHLKHNVADWLVETFQSPFVRNAEQLAEIIALRLRISGNPRAGRFSWLVDACNASEEDYLDVVDCVLFATEGITADELESTLLIGGSIWTINDGRNGLARRVSRTEQASYQGAIAPADIASEQLREAWSKVYGREPDYSDAWDHAIKACEALLCPIVTPKDPKATLGKVITGIKSKPSKFTLRLEGATGGVSAVETFQGMLELIWPNPDRHASGPSHPPIREDQARDVVHLAVLIVNWLRSGSFAAA